jgi:hypothetical protein
MKYSGNYIAPSFNLKMHFVSILCLHVCDVPGKRYLLP